MQGGYGQIGYNVLSQVRENVALTPYYRLEKVNTQKEAASGFVSDPTRDGAFHTFGVEFKPINNIVVKVDHQWIRNRATNGLDQFNIALGYSF
jgi:hypothetical protein